MDNLSTYTAIKQILSYYKNIGKELKEQVITKRKLMKKMKR